MFSNRQRTVNNLQLSNLMKKESPNLYPIINQVYNRANGNIPPNKIVYLAKILKKYPSYVHNDVINMYMKNSGNVSNNDINMYAQSKIEMSRNIINEMKKIGKNNVNKFIEIVKSKGERGKNSKKLTAGEWEAFSKLWFEVHPDSNITRDMVLTETNKKYYNKSPPPSSTTPVAVGVGLGAIAVTAVALLFTGKI